MLKVETDAEYYNANRNAFLRIKDANGIWNLYNT